MKAVYCRDCKHMKVETGRRKYDSDRYLEKFPEAMDTMAVPLFVLTILLCGFPVVIFFVLTFIHNFFNKYTEQMCLFSGQDDLVNGGKIEGTALTCKLYKDSAGCNHFVEKLTLEQEIEETLKKLNEIKKGI